MRTVLVSLAESGCQDSDIKFVDEIECSVPGECASKDELTPSGSGASLESVLADILAELTNSLEDSVIIKITIK